MAKQALDLKFSTQELLDALQVRRRFWQRFDQQSAANHKKAEAAHLTQFRARMREAAKWDYATLKANRRHVWDEYPPDCPLAQVTVLDRYIRQVKISNQKTYTISSNHWPELHYLLTWDPADKVLETVC